MATPAKGKKPFPHLRRLFLHIKRGFCHLFGVLARGRHYDLQIYFILMAVLIILLTLACVTILAVLMGYFLGIMLPIEIPSITLPLIGWSLLFIVIISAAYTAFLTHRIFDPVRTLSAAMKQVTAGNFHLTISTESKVNEIRDIYRNFNLMIRELSATEILQTDFVSNVSHEFKTPLGAIEGYATLLQDSQLTPEEHDDYVEKILYNTRRLSGLVGNILLLSKVENKAIQSSRTVYRLDEQIRQCILALETRWEAKNLELDVDLDSIDYLGNESLMQHVFSNLIDNAVKFSPEGGVLTLRLYRERDRILFTVADQGPGIAPGSEKHIFEKFYQNDTSHKAEGNGLGLSLVKRILDVSEGTVRAENLPEGGCRFTVTLAA